MDSSRRSVAGLSFVLVVACAWFAAADVLLVESDAPVNETTAGAQVGSRGAAVAADRDGLVVAWQSDDGDGTGIFARRAAGESLTPELPINVMTAGDQNGAAVASAETVGFVVAWASAAADGDGYGIVARRYDANAAPLGSELAVNAFTTAGQQAPAVSMDADGSFVIAWESFTQDGDQTAVVARRFDSSGAPLGSEIVVNEFTTGSQSNPGVAALEGGGFAVVWTSEGQDGDLGGIFSRVFDAAGAPVGGELVVNTYTTGDQSEGRVSAARDGGFVVAWSGAADGDADAVLARTFAADGTPEGIAFAVNEFTTGAQRRGDVSVGSDDSFVVVWDSVDQDGDGYGVFARRFLSNGTPDGTEFQVNDYTTGFQGYTNSVASDGDGNYVVVWADGARDGDSFGLYARQLCTDDDGDGDCDLSCGQQPVSDCRTAAAGKSKLTIKDNLADDTRDLLKWKWVKGASTPIGAFLDPIDGTADYRLCIYDSAATSQPLLDAALEPGGQCGDAPCWKAAGTTGYRFSDSAASQHGISKVKLKAGEEGKAQVQVLARGAATQPPAPPLTGEVVVQLLASDAGDLECWETTYAVAKKNIANAKVGIYTAAGP